VIWWHANGRQSTSDDWNDPEQRCLGMIVSNATASSREAEREKTGFLLAFNAFDHVVDFRLPDSFAESGIVLHTTEHPPAMAHGVVELAARSAVVLARP